MSVAPVLFVDRDGTLIREPDDFQIDRYEKFRMVPGAISALRRALDAGYKLVMVSNQDGLGSASFPLADFEGPQALLLDILASEGVHFDAILIDPTLPEEHAETRKPGLGMVRHYLRAGVIDRERSAVIGDRDSDLQLAANMGIRGFRLDADRDWRQIMCELLDAPRRARVQRQTRETRIEVEVDLDQAATPCIDTGLGFFDHMLEQLGVHGGFALRLRCEGDLHIDEHHTVEDCALAIGQALRQALGDRRGIERYGFLLPMDESLAQVALDLSGRAGFVFEGRFGRDSIGGLSMEMVPHFFRSLADALAATLHLSVRGENTHHMVEACFKGVGRCLRQALRRSGDSSVPSSKGVL